ncbi:MAG: P-II family nitrogen regulator [Candidatus Eisenbacteria bacterium]|uniref:P-II family nitrogen regulator n=1 Tax=Eiseniibacteriota bacterium TaxID=2212470 RepID=A0A956NFN8_UNCEI|nr:P-II family nitrogen regulator [Candidatus Eisenbacteria bacterium]
MKLLKAYIRTRKVDEVIRALQTAGAPGITLSRVHGVGYGYDPMSFTLAPNALRQAPEVTKVEVVCVDEDADRLLGVLSTSAHTGSKGDGIVFIADVERAVRIRSGDEGHAALASGRKPDQQ